MFCSKFLTNHFQELKRFNRNLDSEERKDSTKCYCSVLFTFNFLPNSCASAVETVRSFSKSDLLPTKIIGNSSLKYSKRK